MVKIFRGATIYTMNEQNEIIENANLWIQGDKFLKITKGEDIPSEVEQIDISQRIITPGLIDIHTHVGIWGELTDRPGDGNEVSTPFTPMMHAIDGINIEHFSFDIARSGGVTTVQTGPGSGNAIGGIWSILKTGGASLDERVLVEKSGLKGALGENPKAVFGQLKKKKPHTRMAVAHIIREGFLKASKVSIDEKKEAIENQTDLVPFIDVLEGKMPLRLHCHRADDIATAIRISKEFDIKLALEHVTEGHLMLEVIKESGANATLGPYMSSLTKYEVRHTSSDSPKLFHEAGIPFAIMTDHPFTPINYLVLCAAEAVKHGLNETVALRSITIDAAKMENIDDRVGSIEAGKDADFVIWSHHPLDTLALIHDTYINGEKH